jgi:hypothetical protein
MKKFTSLLLTLAMLASLCVSAHAASLDNFKTALVYQDGQFTDVAADSWCAPNVRTAYEFGIMNGKSTTVFDPEGDVTVGQAVIMACRIHNTYYGNGETFGSGYQPYVDYAAKYEMNMLADLSAMDLTSSVTRAGFAVFLSAALPDEALPQISTVEDGILPDVEVESIVGPAIYRLYRAGILTGNDAKGTFSPYSSITRGAAAAIVSRMASPELRKPVTLVKQPFQPVSVEQLSRNASLRGTASEEEFAQAYNVALEIVTPLADLTAQEQVYYIALVIRDLLDRSGSYSSNDPNYTDPYGFLVKGIGSCAASTRATGLCLSILGLPYEHVNENQWGHQWCRVNTGSAYWICDAYGLFCGPEPAPYAHPYAA